MIERIEEIFECIGLTLLILLVFIAAIFRFFGIDMSWSTDLAQLIFTWVCFIGADLALKRSKHMGVDIFIEKLSNKSINFIYLIFNIIILGFLLLTVYYGTNLCIVNINRVFNTLPISYSFATASVPVGGILMIITTGKKIYENIKNIISGEYNNVVKNSEGGEII